MTGIPALTNKSTPDGAHDRDRTGEPLPYQGSALPAELRGLSRVQPTRGLEKVHIAKGMRDHLEMNDSLPESCWHPKLNVCSPDDNDLLYGRHYLLHAICGGEGRIRTSEGYAGRFTVCSLWPLGNLTVWKSPLQELRIPNKLS